MSTLLNAGPSREFLPRAPSLFGGSWSDQSKRPTFPLCSDASSIRGCRRRSSPPAVHLVLRRFPPWYSLFHQYEMAGRTAVNAFTIRDDLVNPGMSQTNEFTN